MQQNFSVNTNNSLTSGLKRDRNQSAVELGLAVADFLQNQETEIPIFGAQSEELWLSQVEALEAISNFLIEGNDLGHIVKVGGSGKTRVAFLLSYIAKQLRKKSLFIVPTQQAVIDFSSRMKRLCPDMEIGSYYSDMKTFGDITFTTWSSMLRLLFPDDANALLEANEIEKSLGEKQLTTKEASTQLFNPAEYGLVHWDENHWYLTPCGVKSLRAFSHAMNLGYTATPRYYEGKEVSNVFGKLIYELPTEQAIERKEISPYTNIVLRTNVTTNLEDLSPEQECAQEVAEAINVPERNLVFPDFYNRCTLQRDDTSISLLGEQTIVFGSTIEHVHHLAAAFNQTLTPLLKSDDDFRSRLREKGIDPDTVEHIALPIHSGGYGDIAAMDLTKREEVIKKYEERKVLCLVSTSLLQQSFNSVNTSVVLDTIPRQTYVGVGQAGMRALRYKVGKHAIIINTEDFDRETISFQQAAQMRGKEEGVKLELTSAKIYRGNTKSGAPTLPIPQYETCTALEFQVLIDGREIQDCFDEAALSGRKNIRLSATSQRIANEYLYSLTNGHPTNGRDTEFIAAVYPWLQATSARLTKKLAGTTTLVDAHNEQLSLEAFTRTLDTAAAGTIVNWSQFNARYQSTFTNKILSHLRHISAISVESIDTQVESAESSDEEQTYGPFERSDFNAPSLESLRYSSQFASPENSLELTDSPVSHEKIMTALASLNDRERDILIKRYGLSGGKPQTLEEVAADYDLSGARISSLQAKAIRKLQQPSRVIAFREIIELPERYQEDRTQRRTRIANVGQHIRDYVEYERLFTSWHHAIKSRQETIRNVLSGLRLNYESIKHIADISHTEYAGLIGVGAGNALTAFWQASYNDVCSAMMRIKKLADPDEVHRDVFVRAHQDLREIRERMRTEFAKMEAARSDNAS